MNSKIVPLILIALTAPAYAQQAPEAEKTPPAQQTSTSSSSSADAEAAATAAVIAKANAAAAAANAGKSGNAKPADDSIAKKAKEFGWHPEIRRGVTVYCREAPVIGSRFTEKRCASDTQLATVLEQQQYQKDQLSQRGCGGNCGGK